VFLSLLVLHLRLHPLLRKILLQNAVSEAPGAAALARDWIAVEFEDVTEGLKEQHIFCCDRVIVLKLLVLSVFLLLPMLLFYPIHQAMTGIRHPQTKQGL